jgi:cytosine/adenosine deaminase-related metal-dependent hydrolase
MSDIVAARIRTARKRRGWSAQELADRLAAAGAPELTMFVISNVGLGSDVGGGTSLSLLQTAAEAYKVGALDDNPMDGVKLFYLATLGSATAMGIDHLVGSLKRQSEADFVVLDPTATPMLAARTAESESVTDLLFALAIMGDDRAVLATYVNGKLAHERDEDSEVAAPARQYEAV